MDLPHIFEPYYRGQNVAFIDGDGLGLASVRRLIDLHGGSVEVRSELGVGSTFTVSFPLRQPDHAHNPRARGSHLYCLNGSASLDDDGPTEHRPDAYP